MFSLQNSGNDLFGFNSRGGHLYPFPAFNTGIQLFLTDEDTKTALSSTDLPTSLDISDWPGPNRMILFFEDNDAEAFDIGGDVLSIAVIPIPPAVWLFGSALGLLGWLRRRGM